MTQTQIQQWAREAGLQLDVMVERYPVLNAQLQAFAALARADLEAEVKVLEKELGNTVSMARADDLIAERDSLKAEVESLRDQVRKEQMYVESLGVDAAKLRTELATANERHAGLMLAVVDRDKIIKQYDAAMRGKK